ncbi:hypothetical protein V5799_007386 [Amblyomma americanum]|uniref:Uncharacterized protein n=1 Tax=Amblyomma americanum TaxID=6943 RepID=A0AAQ4FHJ7_AMBAM
MKPERKKPKAKGKKRRDPSKTSVASQITSPSTGAAESLGASSMWAAPNETTTLVLSGDETGRSDVTSPPRPTRRRPARRQRLESMRGHKERVSSPSPRPKRVEVTRARDSLPLSAGLSTSRGFHPKSSAENVARSGRRGQQFSQTPGSKPPPRLRMMAPGEDAASKAPSGVRSIQAEATGVGASQLDLTRGSSGHNLAPPSAVSRKETNVIPPSKKGSGQSISEGEVSSKDDASGPSVGAKGHSTPPCDPGLGWSYRSKSVRRSKDGQPRENATAEDASNYGEEEESFEDMSADLSTKATPAEHAIQMPEASTPSGHSKQIPRSLGQSWISQVSHEMAGGATPHRGAVLALLKKGMTRKTPGDVAKEVPGPDLHEVPQPCRKLSAISWASEGTYEPTSAIDSRVLKTTATSQSKEKETAVKDKEETVKVKETRSVHIAKPAENSLEVSDVPRVTLRRDSASHLSRAARPRRVVRAPKPKDKVFGASAKHLLAPVLVIPVLILFAFLIAFVVRKTPVRPSKTRLPEELIAACGVSIACIRAVMVMTEALDMAADPCTEFDRFACANWRSLDFKRRSYRREIVHNYTRGIGEALLRVLQVHGSKSHASRGVDNGTVNMAAFYSSCLAFLDASDSQVANASDIIKEMGLDRAPLNDTSAQTDLQRLLEFAVGNSLKTGLPCFVSVTLRGDETFLDIGETLHSTLETSRLVEQFLHSALRSESLAGDDEFLNVLYRVDLSANEWRSRAEPAPFTRTLAADLQPPFSGASWVDALNQGSYGANYSPHSMVSARGIGEVAEIMSILSDDNLTMHHALAYASAVLLAQVLKYDHFFHKEPPESRTAASESMERCLEVTGFYFKDLLPQWITATFVTNERLRAFKTMVKHLQAKVVHHSEGSRRTAINGSEFSKLNVTITGESALNGYGRAPRVPPSSAGYGDQFLLNVVHASRDQVGADYEEGAVERQLRGELSFSKLDQEQFVVAVPASVLVADALVADDNVPSLDYAAIGVRLLLDWVLATGAVEADSDQPATLEQRIQCVRDAASAVFGRSVGYDEGRLLAFADWALDVAWTAAEAHRRNPTGDPAESSPNEVVDDGSLGLRMSRKFFYLRFCHTLCGDVGSLSGACRYRTARSRDFTRAFGCPEPPTRGC